MVPVVMGAEPSVLLTKRTSHLTKHAGQISFPGGRIDPEWQILAGHLAFLVVLIFRPRGLFPARRR